MEKPIIIDLLKSSEYRQIVANMYFNAKQYLDEEFQFEDDRTMISYVRDKLGICVKTKDRRYDPLQKNKRIPTRKAPLTARLYSPT